MKLTRMERRTLWSALKFQSYSIRHITGDDVSRATKGIINVTLVSKATLVLQVIIAVT
jgi:hypothetical protein